MQFETQVRLKVIGVDDLRMSKRLVQVGLALDRPKRVRLGDRANGFDRLRDDAIDERIANDHFVREPAFEFRAFTPLIGEVGQ